VIHPATERDERKFFSAQVIMIVVRHGAIIPQIADSVMPTGKGFCGALLKNMTWGNFSGRPSLPTHLQIFSA
jgi:hypothetical protein